MAFPMLLLPAAIAAGLGELGKHGSLINRTLGSNLRLACVLTDIPLIADTPDDFGADDFCTNCQSCANACPPEAISHEKQLIRGETKFYVDFDRCLPFFNEHQGCAVCLAACPWNRPGVADNLLVKLASRRVKPRIFGTCRLSSFFSSHFGRRNGFCAGNGALYENSFVVAHHVERLCQ